MTAHTSIPNHHIAEAGEESEPSRQSEQSDRSSSRSLQENENHSPSNNDDVEGGDSHDDSSSGSRNYDDNSDGSDEMQYVVLNDEDDDEGESERRDNVRRQYRRRLTLDPLSDIFHEQDLIRMARGDGEEEDLNLDSDRDHAADGSSATNEGIEAEDEPSSPASNYHFMHLIFGRRQSELDADGYDDYTDNNNDPPRPARDHPYLPTPQPLYPEGWIPAGRHRLRQRDTGSGSIENLHSSDDDMVSSFHPQFVGTGDETSSQDDSISPSPNTVLSPTPTTISQHYTTIPTLTILPILEIDNVVLFPGSTLPLRLRNSWVEYLGNLIDDARGLYGTHKEGLTNANEVRIGILPRIKRRTKRHPREAGARTGRWRVELIRRGVTPLRRPRRTRETPGEVRRGSETEATNEQAGARGREEVASAESLMLNRPGQLPSEQEEDHEDNVFHSSSQRMVQHRDPLIGRVGTMATITFTHEETLSNPVEASAESNRVGRQSSMVWRRHTGELVVTALGTTRFRIVDSTKDASTLGRRHQNAVETGVPLYKVEEIGDGNVSFPPNWLVQRPGDLKSPVVIPASKDESYQNSGKCENETAETRAGEKSTSEHYPTHNGAVHYSKASHNSSIINLSIRCATPAIAFRTLWPWRTSQQICTLLQETEAFQGIHGALPTAAGVQVIEATDGDSRIQTTEVRVLDNSAFVNWLGSNLPLDQNDRLDILEMTSVVEQLRYILRKIRGITQPLLRCKYCGTVVAKMSDVFTVGGAEGTTGAYVNEYGVVHQTVTVRKVDSRGIIAVGIAETKDSWFPGYSWTIAHCCICHSHLGWKFCNVRKRSSPGEEAEEDPDRPRLFWGLSSVTSEESVEPQRLVRSRGIFDWMHDANATWGDQPTIFGIS